MLLNIIIMKLIVNGVEVVEHIQPGLGANIYMCYDYVHLDNLSDISAYTVLTHTLHTQCTCICVATA